MLERILIAGSGGQGIITIGKLMATVSVGHAEHVTFFPAYGAEVRGGTSNCQVIMSSDEIPSPVSEIFDSVIIMNRASLDRFLPSVPADCLLLVNTSTCAAPERPNACGLPATEMADRMGDTRVANFIILGKYLACKRILPVEDMEAAIRTFLGGKHPDLVDLNIRAFRAGFQS